MILVALALAVAGEVEVDTHSVEAFVRALHAHEQGMPLRRALRREYLGPGSEAQRTFLRGSGVRSARKLARCVRRQPGLYGEVASALQELPNEMAEVEEAVAELRVLLPEVVLPTVYVHVGCLNSGGTATDLGVHVGLEHFTRPASFPQAAEGTWIDHALHPTDTLSVLVVHELVHVQQRGSVDHRLDMAMMEGGADFVAHLLTGGVVAKSHAYGRAHESRLWTDFSAGRHAAPRSGGWFYRSRAVGEPPDLGYFVGFQIADAFWERRGASTDTLRQLLDIDQSEAVLADSQYAPWPRTLTARRWRGRPGGR